MQKNDLSKYCFEERLKNGQAVTIRAIRPEDKGCVIDVLREVSPESFYRRTFSPKRNLTDEELRRLTEVDFDKVVALAATIKQEGRDKIVGGGRYIRICGAGAAEVAFLIDDAHQGLGIGSRIFRHLVKIARASGIARFEADVLPSNTSMLTLFSRSGLRISTSMSSEDVHVTIELAEEKGKAA